MEKIEHNTVGTFPIYKISSSLEEGDKVSFEDKDVSDLPLVGIVGEIDEEDNCFYIWSNDSDWDGDEGNYDPKEEDYNYSWKLELNSKEKITILEKNSGHMPNEAKESSFNDNSYSGWTTFADVSRTLQVGDRVAMQFSSTSFLKGIVGEKDDSYVYIHSNNPYFNGASGEVPPKETGYLFSYCLSYERTLKIKIQLF